MPGNARTSVLSGAFQRGPSGAYDISYPLLGFSLGKSISGQEEILQKMLGDSAEERARIQAGWQKALAEDPDLLTNPQKRDKLAQVAMTIDPSFLDKMKGIFGAQHEAAQAGRIETLTPAEKERLEAEAGERRERGGLLKQQAWTETFRPPLLEAQTGKESALGTLYGGREFREAEKQPVSLKEIKAGTERLKALAGKLRKETELMPKEGKYQPGGKAPSFREQKLAEMWDQLSEEAKLKVIGALPADKELTENNILSAYVNLMTDPAVREQLKPMVDEILRRTTQKKGPELPTSGRPPVVFK